jgi:D-3-phosphoglycerate dehydrogenase
LDYENSLLEEWGIKDIELIEVKNGEKQHDQAEFLKAVDGAEGVVVEYYEIDKDDLEKATSLKHISLQAIGYGNVDIEAAIENGVSTSNAPGFCSEEVAVHTVGLMIDAVRKFTFLDRSVRKGSWDPLLGGKTFRISGKKVGLVYFGSIPKAMLPLLKALGTTVQVYAPTKTAEYLADFGCEKVETLEELLKTSDFVSMHTPLIPGVTEHLIGEKEFKLMKPTAYFINTARGKVVDEAALVKALKDGTIKGAGVDVIEDEATEQSDLFELENAIITPHAGFVSEDAFAQAREMALRNLVQRLHENVKPDDIVLPRGTDFKDVAAKLGL